MSAPQRGPQYLLDTNILSALVRSPRGPVAQAIARVGETAVFTSIVVSAELRFGVEKSGSPRLLRQVEAVLSALDIRPIEQPVDAHYAILRWHLERTGQSIGPNDMLIAAHALQEAATLVTANVGEFSRVPGLAVENWLDSPG